MKYLMKKKKNYQKKLKEIILIIKLHNLVIKYKFLYRNKY